MAITSRRIGDLVGVRPRPAVVRLEHLDDQKAEWISTSYHLTAAVKRHLKALRHALDRPSGCGFFLIGHFGSGKSHFLAYLAQQLRQGRLVANSPKVTAVSLLNFRATTTLEQVLGESLGLDSAGDDRRLAWSQLARDAPAGTLLIIDELSEFLRSKPTRQSLNEDVRFLQFMGEWAQSQRLWIIAALQEQIEHTGALESSLYRKIKDRYPIRFMLTPEHIRDLLSDSLLARQPGYEEAVEGLAADVRRALPDAAIDFQALQDLYPIHPATIEMLTEVRDLFSQTRGIVDFTINQLLGNPERGIEPFLERPWGDLLTPEVIIDHFADLFEIQPDFLALAQRFLPYYRQRADDLFTTEAQRKLGWRVLKLLMLDHISPQREGFTVADASAWLLFRVTSIAPVKNLQVVERILRRLVAEGRYVRERRGRFFLDLSDDTGERLQRNLQRKIADLAESTEEAIWDLLVSTLGGNDFNPFQLPRDSWQPRATRWSMHERTYQVWFGNGPPETTDGVALTIRLPWGGPTPVPAMATLMPTQLELKPKLRELAALLSLAEKPSDQAMTKLLKRRIDDRRGEYVTGIRTAYLEAELISGEGKAEAARRVSPGQLKEWLDTYAVGLLRRIFPQFERFAPSDGPLPKEAYRQLMRVASEQDIGESDDKQVKKICEGYLVRMGLQKRDTWDYTTVKNLDRHELVRMVMPLIEHRPSPKVVYDHLSGPVYGLVPDQIHLLLIFLLLQGDIDILKGRRSYRDEYKAMPLPIQYDRIEHGRALPVKQLRALEQFCAALRVKHAKQWTVTVQRQAIRKLRQIGGQQREALHGVMLRLQRAAPESALLAKIDRLISAWSALDKGDDELQGFEQLIFEIDTVERFIVDISEFASLPARLDQILGELKRFAHLLRDPILAAWDDPGLRTRFEALGQPPGLDDLAAVEDWLGQARTTYEAYCGSYRKRHDQMWREVGEHAIWSWRPPTVAASHHVALDDNLRALAHHREQAVARRCRSIDDLEFRPHCSCGFNGREALITGELAAWQEERRAIEKGLRLFFRQDRVRDRIRQWIDDGIEVTTGTRNYLGGSQDLPEINDLSLFDQHLAGLELVRELPFASLLELLTAHVWQPDELLQALADELSPYRGKRLRFVGQLASDSDQAEVNEVMVWCIERVLRLAEPLPVGFSETDLAASVAAIRPEWVSASALAALARLGLGATIEDQILQWLLDGTITSSTSGEVCSLTRAACAIVVPEEPASGEELATLCATLYRHHPRFEKLAGERWLDRLAAVADSALVGQFPDLIVVLGERQDWQWLVVDCLGLPLLGSALPVINEALAPLTVGRVGFARVSATTTTDGYFSQLADAGLNQPIEKVNAIDRLLHERPLPFADLDHLAAAELHVALRSVVSRLDPSRKLLLMADHGFRLSPDGRCYVHGGASALERAVPVLELIPGTISS